MNWKAFAALSLGLAVMTGCAGSSARDTSGLASGINLPRPAEPTTAQFRIEAEIVPDARLVREDTTPVWHHGRFGYLPGRELVLVVSRITSTEVYARTDGGPRETIRTERQDRFLERLWIAIPGDLNVGDVLRIQEIENDRRLGYDRGDVGREQYSEPFRALGTLEIKSLTDHEAVIELDVVVRPQRHRDWRVAQTFSLGLAKAPTYATAADPNRVPWVIRDAAPDISSIFTPPRTLGTAPEVPTIDQVATSRDAERRQSEGERSTTRATQDSARGGSQDGELRSAIVGSWSVRTPQWELKMQFEPNGRFAYSSERQGGNFSPGIKRGEYSVEDGKLVMRVTSFDFDGEDHMRHLGTGSDAVIILDATPVDDKLRLKGDFKDREGRMDVFFDRAKFPSMLSSR
ncbi:MAG: hypothetical protein JJU36_12415 [Phycisphaeraceae bacterium]|nr:hypothetical protein [Phycisphaeraceae bacterium]